MLVSLVDERHHYSDVKRVLWREMCLDDRLVMDLVAGGPEPGVLLLVQRARHLHLLPDPPAHLVVVVGVRETVRLRCK